MEQLTAEVTLRESSFDGELEGQNSNPSGAILSLTLGVLHYTITNYACVSYYIILTGINVHFSFYI